MLLLRMAAFLIGLSVSLTPAYALAALTAALPAVGENARFLGKRLLHFQRERSIREQLQLSCLLDLKRRDGFMSADIVGEQASALAAAPADGWPSVDQVIDGDYYEFVVNGTHLHTCFYGRPHTCLLRETSYGETMCCWLAHYVFEHLIVERDIDRNDRPGGCSGRVNAAALTEPTTLSSSAEGYRASESRADESSVSGGSRSSDRRTGNTHRMSSSIEDLLIALEHPISRYAVFSGNQSRCAKKWLKQTRQHQQLL